MDTHRRLWCSWECNDQRQRPIHIAPVPRCRIIIEYDNTQLSLRVYKCNNATPRYTKNARSNRKSQAAGYTLTTRLCANGHKFLYKQVSVLILQIILPLICHSGKFGCDARGAETSLKRAHFFVTSCTSATFLIWPSKETEWTTKRTRKCQRS